MMSSVGIIIIKDVLSFYDFLYTPFQNGEAKGVYLLWGTVGEVYLERGSPSSCNQVLDYCEGNEMSHKCAGSDHVFI